MKNLILFCTILFISACNSPEEKKRSENIIDIKTLNDSIIELISNFQQSQDSTNLKLALSLNDKAIDLDSLDNNLFYNINTRIQILGLLNRKKEAFLIKELILSKDKDNIDRLIYFGQKYLLKNQKDSSEIYFNKALLQCDKLLSDSINTDLIIKKIEIYLYQNKDKDAIKTIDKALEKDSDNITLKTLKENFDEYRKMSKTVFDDIRI